MRRLTAVAAVLLLAGCGGGSGTAELLGASGEAPDYRVLKQDDRDDDVASGVSAELLVEGATAATARAALADFIDKQDGRDIVEAQVVATEDAATYVCSVRWVNDDKVAQLLMGESFAEYPHATVNCP